MSNDEGHEELRQAVDEAQYANGCAPGGTHESEFRSAVVQALKNLTWRVHQLESALEAAEETITRLEGK